MNDIKTKMVLAYLDVLTSFEVGTPKCYKDLKLFIKAADLGITESLKYSDYIWRKL